MSFLCNFICRSIHLGCFFVQTGAIGATALITVSSFLIEFAVFLCICQNIVNKN